ncbi:MAG TPA: PEP-CTERM sorting domain-containing protein [Candidatus Paceibacterota bacterium]|nr:PEP-CTERM sorting domain-containing protein [Candidatus Paceibacterota bacterium]HRZ99810.1 PEP-CTERM sorting domain-containing protein [Candidatus Paceibacterota bacterium]
MKKVLSIMAALGMAGAAVQCFGGAAVFANNYDANKPVYVDAVGTLAPMANSWVQFYTAGNAPIGAAIGFSEDGFFDGGFFEVPGAADNADVSFILKGWTGAATFDTAAKKAEALISQKAGANPGAPTPPNPAALAMPDNFVLAIPEPSTVALALLGGAALLLRRRK